MKKTSCKRALALFLAVLMGLGAFAVLPVSSSAAAQSGSSSVLSQQLNAQSYSAYKENLGTIIAKQVVAKKKADDAGEADPMMKNPITIDIFNPYIPSPDSIDLGDISILSNGICRIEQLPAGTVVDEAWLGSSEATPGKAYIMNDLDGKKALFTPDSGTMTWKFEVPQYYLQDYVSDDPNDDGKGDLGYVFTLEIDYFPINVKDNVATVERALMIDGSIPFAEARSLSFSKRWIYGYRDEAGAAHYEYKLNEEFKPQGESKYVFSPKTVGEKKHGFYHDQDVGGNDLRYTAYQIPTWRTYTCTDVDGFIHENFRFLLEPGEHTISLTGMRENLAIAAIRLVPVQIDEENVKTYAEYVAEHPEYSDATNGGSVTVIEAEYPTYVSDTSIYSSNDRSSAITSPSSPSAQLLNTIGAQSYNTVGQWAAYSFTVDKDGWYNLAMRFKQAALEGLFVSRTIKLSGGEYGLPNGTPTVPFEEAYNTRFEYSKEWQVSSLGDGSDEPFRFYFEKDVVYTVYLEVSLGQMSEMIQDVENTLAMINQCYLDIIKYTGTSPDEYRDYNFAEYMPDTLGDLQTAKASLQAVINAFVELSDGKKGSQIATLEQIVVLLERMKKESEIAANLSNLKSYIGTLGTWLNTCKQQGLLFDYISVQPCENELPRVNANFFESAWFEIRAFFVSFFVDYNNMGVKEGSDEMEDAIDVWLAYGRDQSLIWRNLIDSEFTPVYNIPVRLKLVTAGTLLPSVLAGQGPDVYIGLAASDVINYAIRGAIEDIQGSEGYTQTYGYDINLTEKGETDMTRTYYIDQAVADLPENDPNHITHYPEPIPYETTDEDGNTVTRYKYKVYKSEVHFNYANTIPISLYGKTYGVPETTNFPMLFYRKDVLADLGLDVPRTWDDVLECIPDFQANNAEIGLTWASALTTLIYQKGGSQWLYEDDPEYAGAQVGYGTNTALDAFQWVCKLYTDFSFPVTFDAANRFRTGEMPLIITDYCTMYNQLTVFATEIRGMWAFTSMPGYKDPVTGTINNCSVATLTATVMLYKGEGRRESAWKYMKWQAGADAQASYGNQMVALVGPAAKYATANMQAIENLSWTSAELQEIKAQLDNLASIPNYPGSYIISRYVQFAFLAANNDGADPVTEMYSYLNTINKELTRKREEFGLKTLKVGQTPEEARAEEASK